MKALTKKQKLLTSVVGAVVAVALIITVIALSVSSCSDKEIYVERNAISVTFDSTISVTMNLNNEFAVTEAKANSYADTKYAQNLAGQLPFTVSFSKLIETLEADGKLDGSAEDVVLITIESIRHEDYEKALEIINKVLADKEYKTKVVTLYIRAKEAKIVKFAEEHGISYGKAYFCNKIAKESKSLKADDLASKTIKEIYRLAKEDKSESHISSVVSDLNSSQEEIEPPKEDESSSKPSSSEGTPSDDTPSDDTPSDDTPSDDTPSDDKPSSGQQFTSDNNNSGWISGWY